MPLYIKFENSQPLTQSINKNFDIKNKSFEEDETVFNKIFADFLKNKNEYKTKLKSYNSIIPSYNDAMYLGIDINKSDSLKILTDKKKSVKESEKIKELETLEKEKLEYIHIIKSNIPCNNLMNSIRQTDLPIMPCKYIIDLIRKIKFKPILY